MTLQKDQDPGWWRRGMSKRLYIIVIVVCLAVIVAGLITVAIFGIPLF